MNTAEFIQLLQVSNQSLRHEWDRVLGNLGFHEFQEKMIRREQEGKVPDEERIRRYRTKTPSEIGEEQFQQIVDLVLSFLTQEERILSKDIVYKQFWTSEMNAFAVRVPEGPKLILINRGCAVSFAHAATALTDSAVSTPESEIGAFVRDGIILYMSALEMLTRDSVSNVTDITERQHRVLLGDKYKAELADMLYMSFMVFVIGHELGHHLLGHLGDFHPSGLMCRGNPVLYYSYSRKCEYEADLYAWDLLRRIIVEQSSDRHRGERLSLNRLCIVAPLLLMSLFESADTLNCGGLVRMASDTASHPSGYERRVALEPYIAKYFDVSHTAFIRAVNHFFFKDIPSSFRETLPMSDGALVVSNILNIPPY